MAWTHPLVFSTMEWSTDVAIDYKNCGQDHATLWSAKDQPEYNINFWDFADEWIVIG